MWIRQASGKNKQLDMVGEECSDHDFRDNVALDKLECKNHVNLSRAELSLGSLGGGNHFIELNRDEDKVYLVVHTGSRHLGKQVAEFYQDQAIRNVDEHKAMINKMIADYKAAGREKEIGEMLNSLDKGPSITKDLRYLTGHLKDMYLHDMKITQEYATWNRLAIIEEIRKHTGLPINVEFTTIHNYIDMSGDVFMLRKGAVSAKKGEKLLISLNMRDGSLVCEGLGNPDWNFSAPHGAGRLFSRSKAKEMITMDDYKKSMEGIYSSCINEGTLDESPFAYKPASEIFDCIEGKTVNVLNWIKPIYNFKASDV